MEYREFAPPEALRPIVKAGWTLDVPGGENERFRHLATPDGCVELIHRLSGRSWWGEEQPACFAAGLITEPVELSLGGGSRFVALRFWPWAWNSLGHLPVPGFIGGWRPFGGRKAPRTPDQAFAELPADLLDPSTKALAEAILASRSAAELGARSGRPARWLQRWFEREIGLPPRTYLRLLRFQESFRGLPSAQGTLADHAAAHGYADQAHMAREYREMTGRSASAARGRAKPPFL
ncbi:MAG TPA: helix-turn-helix domain-containing protein [Allosphingosinicella sp.]|nr:helix-turn-helix domain-containing protein [Allosphingosinicella sp.]